MLQLIMLQLLLYQIVVKNLQREAQLFMNTNFV